MQNLHASLGKAGLNATKACVHRYMATMESICLYESLGKFSLEFIHENLVLHEMSERVRVNQRRRYLEGLKIDLKAEEEECVARAEAGMNSRAWNFIAIARTLLQLLL